MNARERGYAELLTRFERGRWLGTRETNVMPNTCGVLVDRGWLESAWEKGGRRLLYRLTPAGEEARPASGGPRS